MAVCTSMASYLKLGNLMRAVPEDYLVSIVCEGKELVHAVAWVFVQELSFYKLADSSVVSFSTDYYNEVCTIKIELKPTVRVKDYMKGVLAHW